MRVLQVHAPYRLAGGEDRTVDAEATLLREAGHEVRQHLVANPSSVGATLGALALAPWNPGQARQARRLVAAAGPDVVHVHNTWFSLSPSVVPALKDAGVPIVSTLHNYRLRCANALLYRDGAPCEDCVSGSALSAVRHACYRDSRPASVPAALTITLHRHRRTWERDVDLFFALTAFGRSRFVAAGLPAGRVVVRPPFCPDPGRRAAPPSASRTLLYVGRLSPEKGVDTIVEAATRLGPSVELTVVGSGPQAGPLGRAAGPNVTFVEWCPPERVRELMLGARALLFPSRWYETFGLVMIEALAAGLPVVGSDLGGTPEIIGGGAGWLAPPGDTDAWCEAMAGLTDTAVDEAGTVGRQRWQSRYSPSSGLASLEAGYAMARNQVGTPAPP